MELSKLLPRSAPLSSPAVRHPGSLAQQRRRPDRALLHTAAKPRRTIAKHHDNAAMGKSWCIRALVPASDDSSNGGGEAGETVDMPPTTGSPRRSVRLTFTCDQCGGRTERLVNPNALERGLVIVQCGECEVWHKIADNQGFIEEYRFTDEDGSESSSDGN